MKKRTVASGEEKLWTVLLLAGAVSATVFLILQIADFVEDSARPVMQRNDLYSALGSVALLLIVGVIAARREQLRREALPSGKSQGVPKRASGRARRKGRA